jgi:hypothetical protein
VACLIQHASKILACLTDTPQNCGMFDWPASILLACLIDTPVKYWRVIYDTPLRFLEPRGTARFFPSPLLCFPLSLYSLSLLCPSLTLLSLSLCVSVSLSPDAGRFSSDHGMHLLLSLYSSLFSSLSLSLCSSPPSSDTGRPRPLTPATSNLGPAAPTSDAVYP